jgi:hypothetical protein
MSKPMELLGKLFSGQFKRAVAKDMVATRAYIEGSS